MHPFVMADLAEQIGEGSEPAVVLSERDGKQFKLFLSVWFRSQAFFCSRPCTRARNNRSNLPLFDPVVVTSRYRNIIVQTK